MFQLMPLHWGLSSRVLVVTGAGDPSSGVIKDSVGTADVGRLVGEGKVKAQRGSGGLLGLTGHGSTKKLKGSGGKC